MDDVLTCLEESVNRVRALRERNGHAPEPGSRVFTEWVFMQREDAHPFDSLCFYAAYSPGVMNCGKKGWLVPRIEQLMHNRRANDAVWRNKLSWMVDELDALERPFAAYDHIRFGSPSSRDRLITAARRAYL